MGYFLRFANDEFCGDTFHESIEEAVAQAEYEFPNTFSGWIHLPYETSYNLSTEDAIAKLKNLLRD